MHDSLDSELSMPEPRRLPAVPRFEVLAAAMRRVAGLAPSAMPPGPVKRDSTTSAMSLMRRAYG